jgi:hypothetical protein
MRVSRNHATVPAVPAAESRFGVVPVWSRNCCHWPKRPSRQARSPGDDSTWGAESGAPRVRPRLGSVEALGVPALCRLDHQHHHWVAVRVFPEPCVNDAERPSCAQRDHTACSPVRHRCLVLRLRLPGLPGLAAPVFRPSPAHPLGQQPHPACGPCRTGRTGRPGGTVIACRSASPGRAASAFGPFTFQRRGRSALRKVSPISLC